MTDPTIVKITRDPDGPYAWAEQGLLKTALANGAKSMERIPVRYRDAVASHPMVITWIRTLIADAEADRKRPTTPPVVRRGRSLLLTGPTGTGKTHEAFGAMRALAVSGVVVDWVAVTAADLYAELRPNGGRVSTTDEAFRFYADHHVLVIDDLGGAKRSEWVDEVNLRLINYRYERMMPTVFITNIPLPQLGTVLDERVRSRIAEMADVVVMNGNDRRRVRA
jgi:DNA replication protein DnaC